MRAVVYESFGVRPTIQTVSDPTVLANGAVIEVKATGVCRSDWHGWIGHDDGITLPHVPGHEFAGVIVAVGKDVVRRTVGERVTTPFVAGCGACGECYSGNQQVCDHQFQPGFTHWGSFAQYVAIPQADLNLVPLPEALGFDTAASLGCRFATSFRAVVDQARVCAGEWVAVHGCGGVGLSAIMIASAAGANVVAIDIASDKLTMAKSLGAVATVDASQVDDVVDAVRLITGGGAHVSIDALGHRTTCFNSISNLRKRGRHVQVGLMLGDDSQPSVPMGQIIANELQVLGSHGMQAHRYDAMFAMIRAGKLTPERLVGNRIDLEASIDALTRMDRFDTAGVTVITQF